MTLRTKGIQRRLIQGIKLSVTKDKEAEGEVSQFGALTTALAATIGTGNIIGVGTVRCPWWSGSCFFGVGLLVCLALRQNTVKL